MIPAGETSVQFSLDVIGDTLPEPDERLRVVASKLQGAEITRDWARGWIRDDDAAVPGRIVLGSAVKPEGDAGDATLSVPVTLDTVTSIPVTFRLVAAGGSAAAGSDYSLDEAAVHTIAAGTTGTSVDIAVHGDTVAEGDETILLALADVTGAYHDATPVASTLLDDDGAAPVLQTRPDRFESGESLSMSVLDNDALSEARVARGTLQVTHVGDGGDAQVEMYDPAQPRSWVIHYTSARGFAGTTTVGYRVCEGAPPGRCADGVATIEVGMSPLWLTTVDGTGFFDTEPAIYQHDDGSPRFIGDYASTPLAAPETLERDHGVDPTPLSPWDGAREGTQVSLHVLPSPAGEARDWKVFVEAAGVAGTEPDIYLGVDTDQGQDAEPSELLCTAAMNSFIESCGLDLTHPGTGVTRYWVLVHNRGAAGRVQTRIYEVPMIGGDGTLTATGPGLPRFGGFERFRGAWRDLTMFPGGTPRVGFVGVRLVEGGDLVWQRWRIEPDAAWTGRAAVALRHGVTTTVALEPGGAHDRMFVDVPQGATALTVTTTSAQDVDLYLARASSPSAPRIDPAPPRDAADASARTTSGNEILMRSGDALPPGRWYVTPVNVAAVPAVVDVRVELAAAATPPRRGSYFDPDRGGHGLFLYPAGSQWAGLWYAYFEDGSPTWYYLQAGAPGPDGIWTAPIYRARWDGDSHAQTAVGFATVTPTGADAFRFTWTLDGRTGSEPMIALGRGCPTDGGQPVDASSHWFNLATAGSGHSVQFWEDYEFYAAFVYDEAGVPRFLTAESNTYLGADATLPIDQLQGFCPLCDRTGAPSRYPVGTLRRTISGGTLTHLGISADFTGGQSGSWERYEPVQPLGGPGTTQGCAP